MRVNTCKSSFVMMIAKMLLLVSVSSSIRSLIVNQSTGGVGNEKKSKLAVNSAGHLQPSTHSSEVSLHHSLIKESQPALSRFGGLASNPAILRSLAPELAKNAIRAVLGGYTPEVRDIPPEFKAAKRVVGKLVELRDSAGKKPLFEPPYSSALCTFPAWTAVNGMSEKMTDFVYATGVFLALRTKFIDEKVRSAIASGFKQIVYLGMGLDTRALRLHGAGVHVVEVDQGEALFMKVQAMTGDESSYPAVLIPEMKVARYLDALSGSVEDDKVLFVWESGSITSPAEVTKELLSKIFYEFPSAMVVFDSAESSIDRSEFLGVVGRAFGGVDMYPGKFDMTDMVADVSEELSEAVGDVAEVQVETIASTTYAETAVPQYPTKFSSYFPSPKDVANFQNIFQHIRFNVMSKKPKESVLSSFGGSASSPATLRWLAPELAKNAIRAVLGGYTPEVRDIPPELKAAKIVVGKLVELRDSAGKKPLFEPPYSSALCTIPAWTAVNGMSERMTDFVYATGVFLALRTKFIDEKVRSAIASGFKQIVYLGMGLDTRALRLQGAGVHVVEVDQGEALFMKVQAMTGDESSYPAEVIPVASVAEYVDALISGSVEDDKVLFVWESGSITSPVEVTKELLSKIFYEFPSAMVVFDSAESSIDRSEFLGVVERAFGGVDMFPGKIDMTDMVADVSEKLSEAVGDVAEVQVETVASTTYAETAVPRYPTKFSSYFPSPKDVANFQNIFQHIRFNVMSKKQ